MNVIAVVVAIALALLLLDQIALWMERRGWIYWRHRKASPGSLGNALLEVHSLLEPDRRALLEVRQDDGEEEQESGEPPDPAGVDAQEAEREG